MRIALPAFVLLTWASAAGPAPVSAQEPAGADPSPHSEAVLVAETTSIRPGRPFTIGLHLTLDPEWHSYWKNPGDSGEATSIHWSLPDGFRAGGIQWPAPRRISFPPLVSYGYFDEVLLIVEIAPPAGLVPGDTVRLAGRADWLVCIEDCFPAEAELALTLPVSEAAPARDPATSALFDEFRGRLPIREPGWQSFARANERFYGLRIDPPDGRESRFAEGSTEAEFFASGSDVIDHAAEQRPDWDGETLVIRLARSAFATGTPDTLRGVLVTSRDAEGRATESFVIEAPTVLAGDPDRVVPDDASAAGGLGLGLGLLFAFLGGLLLNLMPCVFPVLSLKVLDFAGHADEGRTRAARKGVAFAAGVLVSFWALGGLLLALRAAGESVGWGFQLQSPLFVGAMAVLFFLLGLALLGAVEIGASLGRLGGLGAPPGETQEIAEGAAVRRSFLAGVLATLVATPCTAPFMGAALGWALVRPPLETMLVFTALGAGMAAPFLLLSLTPGLVERLPPPGRWMETLKQLLAFPLFATVIWLAWVFGLQTGVGGLTRLLVALLLVGLAAWVAGRWGGATAPAGRRWSARLAALGLGVVAALVLVRAVRQPPASVPADSVSAGPVPADSVSAGSISAWKKWTPARQSEVIAAGKPLFVDFTAAWCLSCQVNERVVLNTPEVRDAFAIRGVELLKADWTRREPEITAALAELGRSSVPVYALHAPGAEDPVLLPSVLTKQIVLDALDSQLP